MFLLKEKSIICLGELENSELHISSEDNKKFSVICKKSSGNNVTIAEKITDFKTAQKFLYSFFSAWLSGASAIQIEQLNDSDEFKILLYDKEDLHQIPFIDDNFIEKFF